jgi:Kef-type K+ transport system membrane component KefB
VLASFTGKMSIALLALFGGAFYGLFMFTLGRKLLAKLFAWLLALPSREPLILPAALAILMLAAWFTDRLGIYAVFGAFILGAAMPREGALQKRFATQIGTLTAVFLLPMFFVNSGLNTSISLLASPTMLGIAALLLVAAIAGKGIACGVAARFAGESKRDSFAIGALMNARGLMELILLNIGYERGMITQTLFTILVIMAVVTTVMAVPLFNRVYRPGEARPA